MCAQFYSKIFRIVLIAGSVALTGCSSGRPPPILSSFECDSDQVAIEKLPRAQSSDPQVSKLSIKGQTVFATTLIECGVRDYVPTRATSRQLLSGFDSLVIKSEEYAETANSKGKKIYTVLGSAEIDKRPISVMAASSRTNECVTDSVFWQNKTPGKSEDALKELIMPIIGCVK